MEKNIQPPEDDTPDLDNLGIYFKSIGKIPVLNAKQEVDLAKQIEAGLYAEHLVAEAEESGKETPHERELLDLVIDEGKLAKKAFINSNLKLVVSMAKKYGASHQAEELTDIIQNGQFGLILAVEKFDYTKGFKFSTFATWWIRQTIQRSGQESSIRVPEHIKYDIRKIAFHRNKFYNENGDYPDVDTLAELTGLKPQRINQVFELPTLISLSEPVGDYDKEVSDFLEDPSDVIQEVVDELDFRQRVLPLLACLEERDKKVLLMRYGFETGTKMTTVEVAKELGISRSLVGLIEKKSIETLKQVATERNYDTLAL